MHVERLAAEKGVAEAAEREAAEKARAGSSLECWGVRLRADHAGRRLIRSSVMRV